MTETVRGSVFEAVPLLLLPIVSVATPALLMGAGAFEDLLASTTVVLPLSGGELVITAKFVVMMIGLFLLMWEIVRSAYNHTISIQNHAFSLVVFLGAAFAFTQLNALQTETFLFLVLLAFVDVIAGVYITIKTRTRKVKARSEVINVRADIAPQRS